MLQETLDNGCHHEMHSVAGPDWIAWSRRLAMEDGIFMGISGGYTFAMAMKLAEDALEGSVMLVMLPDTGERYLSTPLFDRIAEQRTKPRSFFAKNAGIWPNGLSLHGGARSPPS